MFYNRYRKSIIFALSLVLGASLISSELLHNNSNIIVSASYGNELTNEVKDLLNNAPRSPGTRWFPIYDRRTSGADLDMTSKNAPAGGKAYTDGTYGIFVMNDKDIEIMDNFAKEHFTDDMDVATRLWTVWKYLHE